MILISQYYAKGAIYLRVLFENGERVTHYTDAGMGLTSGISSNLKCTQLCKGDFQEKYF